MIRGVVVGSGLVLVLGAMMFLQLSFSDPVLDMILNGLLVALVAWMYIRMQRSIAAGERLSVEVGTLMNNQIPERAEFSGLTKLVAQAKHSASNIGASSDQVATLLKDTERASCVAQNNAEAMATAIHEMSVSADQVASTTTSAAESTQRATGEAKLALEATANSVEVIEGVAQQIATAGEVIVDLVENSKKIDDVLQVINEIAEQTNLLALNAAIEAARAGEHGRGFAVVADEVRSLAQRSKDSTANIREMVIRLQESSAQATYAMQNTTARSREGVDADNRAKHSLGAIVSSFNENMAMTEQIATTAQQQSSVVRDMDMQVIKVAEMAKQTYLFTGLALSATNASVVFTNRLRDEAAECSCGNNYHDFAAAKAAHLNWKRRVRALLDGEGGLTIREAVSHRDCAFGKWYFSEGEQNHGTMDEFKQINEPHARLHQLVRDVIEAYEAGNIDEAESGYLDLTQLSCEICNRLDAMDQHLNMVS